MRDSAEAVRVPNDVLAMLGDLRKWCSAESIPVSDRRWRKVVKLLQTSALTNGRDTVSIWDCWLLQHCIWSKTENREKIYGWYASRVGAATDVPSRLIGLTNALEGQLRKDEEDRSQLRDEEGNLLYMGNDGKHTSSGKGQTYRDGEPLFAAPEGAREDHYNGLRRVDRTNEGKGYTEGELDQMFYVNGRQRIQFCDWSEKKAYLKEENNWIMTDLDAAIGPTRHKAAYVEYRLQEIRDLRQSVEHHEAGIEGQIESFERDIRSHLWVTEDFVEPASKGLLHRRDEARKLLAD